MLDNHLSQLTNKQLLKRNKFCLGIAIGFLLGMIVILVLALKQISDQNEAATFTALGPVVIMPLILIPLTY